MPKFTINFTPNALEHLQYFRKFEQKIIVEAIKTQLPYEPLTTTAKTPRHIENIEKLRKWIESVYFDDDIADVAASIFRDLKQRNQLIEYRDIFIAATAKRLFETSRKCEEIERG